MITLLKDLISMGFYTCGGFSQNLNRDHEITLVYHAVSDMKVQDDLYKINVHPQLFAQHLELMSKVKIAKMVLTFDDGFENFFSNAFVSILRYNIKTALFISTDFIEGKISFDHLFGKNSRLKPLTWQQLRKIADSGIEIGSHTISHKNLADINMREAHREITDSKKIIEDKIGKAVKYFAYPYGSKLSFNKRIKEAVMAAGYEKAFVNIMGFNHVDSDQYELKRIRIYNNDNMPRFRMKIAGAYSWIDLVNSLRGQKE